MTHILEHTGRGETLECESYDTLHEQAVSFVRECRRNAATDACKQCMYVWCTPEGKPLAYRYRHFTTCEAYKRGGFPAILLDGKEISPD